ncbi:MAG: single-stranded DNA-binding protein [Treponema sp.]|nr:single-stranded DNA-binding protein [Treponema sp.]
MAADMNTVFMVGRLTRNMEVRYSGNGYAVGHFSLANNRRRKNGDQWIEEANYFDVTIFGKSADGLKAYLTQGKQVAVQGYLQQDRWEKDGQKYSRVSIVATDIQLLGSKSGSYGNSNGYNAGNNNNGGFVPNQNMSQNQNVQPMNNGFAPNSNDMQNNNMQSFNDDMQSFPKDAQSFSIDDYSEDIPF